MQSQDKSSRKTFMWWGTGLLVSLGLLRFFKTEKKPTTTKMLTQDGRLVEIDSRMLKLGGKKITNQELQQWVKKNKS